MESETTVYFPPVIERIATLTSCSLCGTKPYRDDDDWLWVAGGLGGLRGRGAGVSAVIGGKIEAIASTWPSHATLAYAADCPPSLLSAPKLKSFCAERKNK